MCGGVTGDPEVSLRRYCDLCSAALCSLKLHLLLHYTYVYNHDDDQLQNTRFSTRMMPVPVICDSSLPRNAVGRSRWKKVFLRWRSKPNLQLDQRGGNQLSTNCTLAFGRDHTGLPFQRSTRRSPDLRQYKPHRPKLTSTVSNPTPVLQAFFLCCSTTR